MTSTQWGSHAKPVEPGVEIQDPYSVRCAPQILGAFQEALWHIEYVVTRELNASTDNPLVFPQTQSVIHCGNFYGQQISMVCDYLRLGLAKTALLLERQLERLVNWRYSQGLPPLLSGGDPGLNSGFMGVQLLATSLAAECRMLSAPASVQTIPTNANNQDVVSMGCISARLTRQLTDKLWKILAVQSSGAGSGGGFARTQEERDGRRLSQTPQAGPGRLGASSPMTGRCLRTSPAWRRCCNPKRRNARCCRPDLRRPTHHKFIADRMVATAPPLQQPASGPDKPGAAASKARWTGRTRGGYFGNWFFVQLIRVLGLRGAYAWLVFVAAYFTFASPRSYRASVNYLQRVLGPKPWWQRPLLVYRHFFSFGVTLLDRLAVVIGPAPDELRL